MRIVNLFIPFVAALFLTSGAMAHNHNAKISGSTVIDFEPGKAMISENDRQELRDLVATARAEGKIKKVEVAVWSDKDYPRTADLPRADQKLADARAEAIKEALKGFNTDVTVKVFNMADRTNWLSRTFGTADAELDSVFSKDTAEIQREDFQIIKDNGGPSKAVVVAKMKDKKSDWKMSK